MNSVCSDQTGDSAAQLKPRVNVAIEGPCYNYDIKAVLNYGLVRGVDSIRVEIKAEGVKVYFYCKYSEETSFTPISKTDEEKLRTSINSLLFGGDESNAENPGVIPYTFNDASYTVSFGAWELFPEGELYQFSIVCDDIPN